MILELISVLIYVAILIIVLIFAFSRSKPKNRKFLSAIVILMVSIVLLVFVYIPILQFIFFSLVIVDVIYIVYGFILPPLYTPRESNLFAIIEDEVWEQLKTTNTVAPEEEK